MGDFARSSFGVFLMALVDGVFTTPSRESFLLLARGWVLTSGRHTITTYLWLSGAVAFKHFTRFYVFLGCPLFQSRWKLWSRILRMAAGLQARGTPIIIVIDDTVKKKSGTTIEGIDRYNNRAGSARQEYRTLRGHKFIVAVMLLQDRRWPGHDFAIPIALELYLKEGLARKLGRPYRSGSAIAREIMEFVKAELPGREIRVIVDGGYARKEFLPLLPEGVEVISRLLVTGQLYEPPVASGQPGRPAKKGRKIGSPKTLAKMQEGWTAHPEEEGAEVRVCEGIWHSVFPGRLLRVVVVRRDPSKRRWKPGERKPRPLIEAFFTTDLSLDMVGILESYDRRWMIEIDFRDANEFYGLGGDQCRKLERIVGANTLRLVLASARTLWFLQETKGVRLNLLRYRPWYWQKKHPSQLDIVWMCWEMLQAGGISPTVRFAQGMGKKRSDTENAGVLAG